MCATDEEVVDLFGEQCTHMLIDADAKLTQICMQVVLYMCQVFADLL